MFDKLRSSQMDLGDFYSLTTEFFKKNAQDLLTMSLVLFVPINLIGAYFLQDLESKGIQLQNTEGLKPEEFMNQLTPALSGLSVPILLEGVLGLLLVLAIYHYMDKKIKGEEISWQDALSGGAKFWLNGFTTNLILGIFLIGLFLLLIVPGIVFGIYWTFALAAIVFAKKSNLSALSYSKDVVTGKWWTLVGYSLLAGILASIISGIFGGFVSLILSSIPVLAATVVSTISTVIELFFNIFFAFVFINWDAMRSKGTETQAANN